ncbi:hypothetical protein CTAYLR_004661 [Chrysophaeum taylorii]|uniref:Formyl transferase N-terminal domain-containing protein n=1 Tax=Chrysophaeum taylorii TaxID=2483200 RepID=A0AAD7U777_9STRA|nr:hypothetical protein CTAYLR_004661 [Chrysophaeum taylorii]
MVVLVRLVRCASSAGRVRVACDAREAGVAAGVLKRLGCAVKRVDEHRAGQRVWERVAFECERSVEREVEAKFADLSWSRRKKRVAVMASVRAHALDAILSRREAFGFEVPVVVSNHEDLRPIAESCGVPYRVFEITPESKARQEERELAVLRALDVDVVVLARYMQILTEPFCRAFEHRIINVHPSVLPAFPGANAYLRARRAGVKLVGATAHYATAELDAGPIIAQAATACTHADTVADLDEKGAALETAVLLDALCAHLEDRVFVHGNSTIVFPPAL